MKRGVLIILTVLSFLSCNPNREADQEDNSQFELTTLSIKYREELELVDSLINAKRYLTAKLKLDTLIAEDTSMPTFYLERAVCETQLMLHREAIEDFKVALRMGYKEDLCRAMIKFNEGALKDDLSVNYL